MMYQPFQQYQFGQGTQYPPFQPSPMWSSTRPPSSPFSGRVVASPDEIQVQEVPTDGTMALFLLSDGSGVIGKRWAPDGSIQTTRFAAEQVPTQPQEDPIARLEAKVDGLVQAVASLSEQAPKTRARKAPRAEEE